MCPPPPLKDLPRPLQTTRSKITNANFVGFSLCTNDFVKFDDYSNGEFQ